MEYPNYYSELIEDLNQGIDNTRLYRKYSFNINKGIKIKKNHLSKKIEVILIVWNKQKSVYDNVLDYKQNLLTYIGSGISSKQEVKRENQTLVNYFDEDWQIPIILCSKIDKQVSYVSMLKQSKYQYDFPDEKSDKLKFHFTMYNIKHNKLMELSNIIPNKKIPWKLKSQSRKNEKKNSLGKIISDEKLRQMIKEFQFIGDMGELVALDYEYSRLQSINLTEYIEFVEHVSVNKGHGYGYDIKSYDFINGKIEEIYIEVKSTSLSKADEFYMSQNEHQTMLELGEKYRIYRVYDIYDYGENLHVIENPAESLTFNKQKKIQYTVKLD